jgi:acyl dehydratase
MTITTGAGTVRIAGPFFDDLRVGDRFDEAPALTLTDGHAALHQAILGNRLRVTLDVPLARQVVGADARVASPGLVWDVAIGQSTLATHRVVANLFYRGLQFHRMPMIGDTLRTVTEVVALRENSSRPDRAPTGLAALRVTTVDQADRAVLDFWRCAMLPLSESCAGTEHADDLGVFPTELDGDGLRRAVAGWRLDGFRAAVPGAHFADLVDGTTWQIEGGDVVSAASELARLALNVAIVHHDEAAGGAGRRLVYGGHTIGLAAAHVTRALPNLVTIVGWHGCEHLAPVYEGDTLHSVVALERREALPGGGGLVHLRARVSTPRDGATVDVLDWRLVGVMA